MQIENRIPHICWGYQWFENETKGERVNKATIKNYAMTVILLPIIINMDKTMSAITLGFCIVLVWDNYRPGTTVVCWDSSARF